MKKIAVISDPQLDLNSSSFENDYKLLSNYFKNMEVDYVVGCGDITENGDQEEWNMFFKAYLSSKRNKKLFFVPGNMDKAETQKGANTLRDAFSRHMSKEVDNFYSCYETEEFILFGIAVEENDDINPLTSKQLEKLDKAVCKAAKACKPIIVFGHYILNETIDIDWRFAHLGVQSYEIKEIFERHQGKVLYFSGHIHRGLFKEGKKTLSQVNNVTYISTPSLCHPDSEHYDADNDSSGTCFILEVSKDSVLIEGFDFANKKKLDDFKWLI